MKALATRTIAWLFDAVGTESLARLFLFAIAAIFGIAGAWTESTILWTVACSIAATGVVSYLRRMWEYRYENYTIISRENTMRLQADGRRVVFEVRLRVRSAQKNLRFCAVRFNWSGQSDLVDGAPYVPVGTGFTIEPERTPGFINVKFNFDQPLRKYHTRQVGIRFTLDEPERSYTTYMGLDGAAWAWSPLSKFVVRLIWEDHGLVDVDSIRTASYRSGWDRYMRSTGAMRAWTESELSKMPDENSSREWVVTPVRHDRYYFMEWRLTR